MTVQRRLALAPLLCALILSSCSSTEGRSDTLKTSEQQRWSQLFKMIDTDGNGRISPEEFRANYTHATWMYFDRNGDGVISQSEWAIDGVSIERRQWFAGLDENGDGVVTREEFERAASDEGVEYFFALADKNGDGEISRKEVDIL